MRNNQPLDMLTDMLCEAERELRYLVNPVDVKILTAKRDAIAEALARLRDGRPDPFWCRSVPT